MSSAELSWQTTLFGIGEPEPDDEFTTLLRRDLEHGAWVDHAPGWLRGSDTLFQELLESAPWQTSTQVIYD
ncbi:MAG: alpha-ketoglutarate-dependent dioxygenase AlkB, partial [Candidatus Dormibacteraeota bacterium]|nr:alpha-ketoglutarate-dependent dioxygenase AlkB [Candidatus Dormibacteraeota bacterium]